VIAGRNVTFSGNVTNASAFASTQSVRIEFRAIGVQEYWEGPLCDAVEIGPIAAAETFDLANLAPRNVYTTIPAQSYAVEMRIDPENNIREWNEANNRSLWRQIVVLPDRPNLTVTSFDFAPQDADPAGGTSMTFSAMIHNTGSRATTETITVEFCIWPTLPIRPRRLFLCNLLPLTSGLVGGDSIPLPDSPRRINALPPGAYYVAAIVDPTDAIAEQREDDNMTWVAHKKLYVGPRPTTSRRWHFYK
jgi:hypothetical protein